MSLTITLEKPNNQDLEEAVIGAILMDSSTMNKIIQILNEDSFYQDKFKYVYKACVKQYKDKKPIDLLTVATCLKEMKLLGKVGGPHALVEFTTKVASTANVEFHAHIIRQHYLRRMLIDTCTKLERAAYDPSKDIDSLMDKARKEIFINTASANNRVQSAKYYVEQIVKESKAMQGQFQEVRGIATGFTEFDLMTSGLIGSRFYVIGGRPSMGKTTFAINIAVNAVKKFKRKGLFFSGEMTGKDITTIMISKQSGIPMNNITTNRVNDENWKDVLNEFDDDFENLLIDDTPRPSLMHVQSESIKGVENGVGFIIIDFL